MSRSNWPTTSRHERGYGSEWDKLRKIILRRDNGLCQCSECQGGKIRVTQATEVHHVVSKAEAKLRRWTAEQVDAETNLSSRNKSCHMRETMAEQGKALAPQISIGVDGWPENGDGGGGVNLWSLRASGPHRPKSFAPAK